MLVIKVKDKYGRYSSGGNNAYPSRNGKVWASRSGFHCHLAMINAVGLYSGCQVVIVSHLNGVLRGWEVPFGVYNTLIRTQKTEANFIAALEASANLLICNRIPTA